MSAPAPLDFGRTPPLAPIFARLRERMARRPAEAAHAVGARHDGDGWKVLLLGEGEALAVLDAEAARGLAQELLTMADVIEGRSW